MPMAGEGQAPPYEAFLELDTGTHTDDIHQLLLTPDGRSLVSAGECTIRLWDLQTRVAQRMLLGQVGARSEEVFGPGNVLDVVLSPDGRWLVALKIWYERPLDASDNGDTTELQVFELSTGNLHARFEHPSRWYNLDFSLDGRWLAVAGNIVEADRRLASLSVYAARDVIGAGFGHAPAPAAVTTLGDVAADDRLLTALRFVPVGPANDGTCALVAATQTVQESDFRGGQLTWLGLAADGRRLVQQRMVQCEDAFRPDTLAVSHEYVVIAAVPRGRGRTGRVHWQDHQGSQAGCITTDAPARSTAFAPAGCHLLVGSSATAPGGEATAGATSVQVDAYAADGAGFVLQSSYFGHDGDITAVAFLGDNQAVSAGGDNHALHIWDYSHRVGRLRDSIRGLGVTFYEPGVNAREQLRFGTVPPRLLPAGHPRRQQSFDLRTLQLDKVAPSPVREGDDVSRKWVLPRPGQQVLPLWRRPDDDHQRVLEPPPDLTLYVGADDEWVIWCPSGYYAASAWATTSTAAPIARPCSSPAIASRLSTAPT